MLKIDCIHFPGDRPCDYHKKFGIKCDDCNHYQLIGFKILVIKLDAVGDVLRTTSILPPLKNKYPGSHITWCTRKSSKEIFEGNQYVNEVIYVEEDTAIRLSSEKFDLVINLDTSKFSSSIASLANGISKIGFVLSPQGFVEPTSKEAMTWLEMSAFDDVKRENQESYQKIMYNILQLNSEISRPILNIPDQILKKVTELSATWKLSKNPIVGLNIGVGTKWPSKGYPLECWKKLISELSETGFNLLLLGGEEERESIKELSNDFKDVVNTGTENSIMEFAAIVNMCDVVVTADSFALHIATALGKKIVALFGPTSISEIDLYGKGEKIISPKECKCYYKKYCTEEISCMQEISPGSIIKSIRLLLND